MDCDGLRVCERCGDRETTGRLCWACREQEMIDNDDYVPSMCPKCHSIHVVFDWHDDGEHWECQKCGHKWFVEHKHS